MTNSTPATVAVALDVHASSVYLAAARRDELLAEQTLPYDHQAVHRAVSLWPGARVCYEAGPTGFGLARHLIEPYGRGQPTARATKVWPWSALTPLVRAISPCV